MSELLRIFASNGQFSFSSLLIFAILIFVVIKAVYDAGKWIKNRFDNYHKQQNKNETQEQRIAVLEEHDEQQAEALESLNAKTDQIINALDEIKKTQNKTMIENNKGVIYRIHRDVMEQGYISQTELDRFELLVSNYRNAGGNGVIEKKLYPEVMELPIRRDE